MNPDADNGENNQPAGTYGKFYVSGNYLDGNPSVTANNALGVVMGSSFRQYAPSVTLSDILVENEFPCFSVTTHSAMEAYEKVLEYAGCSLARDKVDARYIQEIKNGTYTYEGSNGSTKGLIDSQNDVGGWPEYKTYDVKSDSNRDGIPDEWLMKNYPGEKAEDKNEEGYTYLEVYLNSLVDHLMR